MAKTRICWTCWKKTSVWTAKPLLYLVVCHYFINNETIYNAHWFIRCLLWLVHCTLVLIIMAVIMNLVFRPTWYDEESPDEHCHILDTHDKMAREQARMIQRLVEVRDELRAEHDANDCSCRLLCPF
ncbi:hypothetical protein F5B18DRAFT_255850 [Nemania serpens]|nr:hypothetical protein F5B18DRAFT_255850 [Nemania serpens]